MGWLIAAGLILVLLWTKVGVRLRWESQTMVLRIRMGWLRFSLPKRKPSPNGEATDKPQSQAPRKKGITPAVKKWLLSTWDNRDGVLGLVGRILRSPALDLLRLHIAVGSSDPADCAMTYGTFCAGLSAALPVIGNTFRIRKQDVNVVCTDQTETSILAELETTVRIYEVFALTGGALGLFWKLYRSTKSNVKAVQLHESSSS